MARVFADHHHATMSADDLALFTNFLDAGLNLHAGFSLVAVGNSTPGEVIWSEFDLDFVARQDADVVHTHLS